MAEICHSIAMKVVSWNVNGIRAVERKGALQDFLRIHKPDVLLLQEIKGTPDKFSPYLTKNMLFSQYYHPAEKPGYAGTGVWVDNASDLEIVGFSTGIPGFEDTEGRVSRIDIKKDGKRYAILGVYFPNGGKSSEAWDGKLVFYEDFLNYVNTIRQQGIECIWGGDVNCAHNEIDLARPKENKKSIGFLPEERAWVSKVIDTQWVDVFRYRNPEKVVYSWWSMQTRARARNVGWRIDYFFVDQSFETRIKNIEYLTEQMGSDHCPVVIEF
jgi:exodeoxyribonuclease-3